MLNILKSITGKSTPKSDKPEKDAASCGTEKSADNKGGCCGDHCH